MKLWGVFTNFYDGITIDGREVLVSEHDTKDDALKEAIRYGLQILNHFKTDDFMNERLYGKQEPDDKYKLTVAYEPVSVTLYEKRETDMVPVRKWSCKEVYDMDSEDLFMFSIEGNAGLFTTL